MTKGTACGMLVIRHTEGRERVVECGEHATWEVRGSDLLLCEAHCRPLRDVAGALRAYPPSRPWWKLW